MTRSDVMRLLSEVDRLISGTTEISFYHPTTNDDTNASNYDGLVLIEAIHRLGSWTTTAPLIRPSHFCIWWLIVTICGVVLLYDEKWTWNTAAAAMCMAMASLNIVMGCIVTSVRKRSARKLVERMRETVASIRGNHPATAA